MVIHNSFADFVLFLYVHMAHADGDLHVTEVKVIKEKMAKLFPGENVDKKFAAALDEYNAFDKKNLNKLFHASFAHFDTVKFAQKYRVYGDMYDIIYADGKVLESETKALEELKDIIDINAEIRHSKL
ncbi:MAG TPA: TerB family tellurite resistance protein [Cyclobacteriaceae bacterium]|nr:TerB family tellurite resistance protein [Cyclobacteriaceae bacterium]HMV10399.1 TerB family tellurite resistance protein [Cyclobacteriaceae bacterium]HMV90774.1 TerB family tellurite resistance protein [Cyclobacteriaceae bacterium]HMX00424.1 TerB family tellurite resistance protein [Cyclobacteriaceae bacterium]HMX50492.1 TerB family tellurite resistance protein [Cyclobacteriaceae bacterium]